MRRKKLVVRRLESEKQRRIIYSKRKKGILKKAKEISVLCEVDIALLMFSPTSKPSLFTSPNKDLSAILERLSMVSIEEREHRRAYTIKILKKMYKDDIEIEIESRDFSSERDDVLKMQEDQLEEIKEKINEKSAILRDWQNPSEVKDLAQIKIMEEHLNSSLRRFQIRKSELQNKHQREHDLDI